MSDSSVSIGNRQDPRIERTTDAVRRGTLQVLAERGYVDFTVEAVAAAARVAKSTIYRHWPTRIELIADALQSLNRQPELPGASASTRGRIQLLLTHLADAFSHSQLSACIPALIEAAERHPEAASFLHTYSAERRHTLVQLIEDGIASGDLPGHLDPELAALALAGPIIYCRILTPRPLGSGRVQDLMTQVLGPAP